MCLLLFGERIFEINMVIKQFRKSSRKEAEVSKIIACFIAYKQGSEPSTELDQHATNC